MTDFPRSTVSTKYGPLTLTSTSATTVAVQFDALVINGVPCRGYAYLCAYPDGIPGESVTAPPKPAGWDYLPQPGQRADTGPARPSVYNHLTVRRVTSVGPRYEDHVSQAAFRKIRDLVRETVNAWAATATLELTDAAEVSARNAIDGLEAKIAEAQGNIRGWQAEIRAIEAQLPATIEALRLAAGAEATS